MRTDVIGGHDTDRLPIYKPQWDEKGYYLWKARVARQPVEVKVGQIVPSPFSCSSMLLTLVGNAISHIQVTPEMVRQPHPNEW